VLKYPKKGKAMIEKRCKIDKISLENEIKEKILMGVGDE
jgi:hypothetical protein